MRETATPTASASASAAAGPEADRVTAAPLADGADRTPGPTAAAPAVAAAEPSVVPTGRRRLRGRRRAQASAAGRSRRSGPLRALRSLLGSVWLLAAILVAWEVAAGSSTSIFFPPPSGIAEQFRTDWLGGDASRLFLSDLFWEAVPVSLGRLAAGWAIAAVVGVVIGVALGRSTVLARMYSPLVRVFLALPNAALLPVAFMIFGATNWMNIFLIAFGVMWVVVVNTADGVAGVDEQWLRSARSLHLGRVAFYRRVLLPAASPAILTGLRVSVGLALILMIISELYATTAGLGFEVMLAQQTFRYRSMWAAFVVIALIGVVLNAAMSLLEKRLLRWHRRTGLAEL